MDRQVKCFCLDSGDLQNFFQRYLSAFTMRDGRYFVINWEIVIPSIPARTIKQPKTIGTMTYARE